MSFDMVLMSAVVAALFGILITLLGWLGSKLFERIDALASLVSTSTNALHGRVGKLEHRLTVVEVRYGATHAPISGS